MLSAGSREGLILQGQFESLILSAKNKPPTGCVIAACELWHEKKPQNPLKLDNKKILRRYTARLPLIRRCR
jgi:hypothetical protein